MSHLKNQIAAHLLQNAVCHMMNDRGHISYLYDVQDYVSWRDFKCISRSDASTYAHYMGTRRRMSDKLHYPFNGIHCMCFLAEHPGSVHEAHFLTRSIVFRVKVICITSATFVLPLVNDLIDLM